MVRTDRHRQDTDDMFSSSSGFVFVFCTVKKQNSTVGSCTESPMGEECSFDSFDSEVDGGGGMFGEKGGRGHEGEGPSDDDDGGAEEIRRVDEEIESKVRDRQQADNKQTRQTPVVFERKYGFRLCHVLYFVVNIMLCYVVFCCAKL